jgi:hypothetical protein
LNFINKVTDAAVQVGSGGGDLVLNHMSSGGGSAVFEISIQYNLSSSEAVVITGTSASSSLVIEGISLSSLDISLVVL